MFEGGCKVRGAVGRHDTRIRGGDGLDEQRGQEDMLVEHESTSVVISLKL